MSSKMRDTWCHRDGRDGGEKSEYGVTKVDVVNEDMTGVDGLETLDSEREKAADESIHYI
ncbi:hypothetical protein DVH24_033304 [Malus domestica]|uniref:Uncharacterized protein n=1 Tax=Malus domestica TaxID=3750 RepID=A0A498J9N2_MALDO|nr:hypothetical protein DVH24_033304 [Malus domestica]